MTAQTAHAPPASGLTIAEVEDRVARGQVNRVPNRETRSVSNIVRANVFTRFNVLITALLVVIVLVAPLQDALFGLVMVVNTTIGIYQEVKAKRTLDRLTLLTAPRVRVVRGGAVQEVAVSEVVLDDLIDLAPGDQLVVDGTVTDARGLEIDESLLTGESDPVVKRPGDQCLSGSFAVAGTGRYVAEAVGKDAFAVRLTRQARRFTPVRSELREGIDWVLRLISWMLPPTIALLVWSQASVDQPMVQAIAGAVAGSVAAVPQGLVLLTSIAFAVGVIRLGRRSVLVRELAAVEGLARVDTVCFDKTGTLTTGRLLVHGIERLLPNTGPESVDVEAALGALAHHDPAPNATLRALGEAFAAPEGWTPTTAVPFSPVRKWSGATFPEHGSFVLGAPEVVAPTDRALLTRVDVRAEEGWRVLLLARKDERLGKAVTPDVVPVALVLIGEELRPDAANALDYLAAQGVTTKVISGDHPRTVAAVAARVGGTAMGSVVDARRLPEEAEQMVDTVERASIFGRVTPRQKRAMIAGLQRRGHTVAMIGDGVNDVLAVKDADLGIAIGSGSSSLRAVAQVVLLEGDFGMIPEILAEGRRVAANVERVANLFLTKTVYAFLLAVAAAIFSIVFPFLPRHLTLVGSLTIGIPGFFLALEPTAARARPGFVARVMRFAIPTGAVAATATFFAYLLSLDEGVTVVEGRTVATMVLGAIGMMALAMVATPLNAIRRMILAGVAAGFVIIFLVPFTRHFFALDFPRPTVMLETMGVIALTGALLLVGLRVSGWVAHVVDQPPDLPDRLRPLMASIRQRLQRRGGRR